MNYEDHAEVLAELKRDQDADSDNRELLQEELDFIYVPGGQWEDWAQDAFDGRPQYTFDQCWPQINKAWSEMAANEYVATVQPLSGGADEDKADIIDGLLRAIFSASSFDDISTRAGKRLIAIGEGAVRVVSVEEGETFHSDLRVIPLTNSHERVWFSCDSKLQTRSDSPHVNVLTEIYTKIAKEKWKDRDSFESVDTSACSTGEGNKPSDQVVIGELLYKKRIPKQIHLLNDRDGTVVDDKKLAEMQVDKDSEMVVNSKTVYLNKVFSRKYDNSGWLEEEKETVFDELPVIPFYAHFDVIQNKVVYHGIVRPIMDACRILNYVESRKVEDSVLGIPELIWLSSEEAEGSEDEFADLNRDPRRVHTYKYVDGQRGPFRTQGGMPSPALSELSQNMQMNIELTTGLQNVVSESRAGRSDSDFRFNERATIGQMGTFEYYRSYSVGLEQVTKVIIGAIPNTYDARRAIKITNESGQSSEVLINDISPDGGEVNDLTIGKYDISMKITPSRKSMKSEANAAIIEAGQIIPGLIERNTDIITNNIDAPGMNTVADRERAHLFKAGMIPESQFTDVEREQAQAAAQQPKEKTPEEKIGEAELKKSENQAMEAQYRAIAKQAELEMKKQAQEYDQELRAMDVRMKEQAQEFANLKTLTESLLNIVNATGADAVMSPDLGKAISGQAQLTIEQQGDIEQLNR